MVCLYCSSADHQGLFFFSTTPSLFQLSVTEPVEPQALSLYCTTPSGWLDMLIS